MAIARRSSENRDAIEYIRLGTQQTLMDRIALAFKAAAASIQFSRQTWWTFGQTGHMSSGGTISYTDRVGDGRNNAIIMACVELASITFAQSPPQVMQKKDDSDEIVPDHEMVKLLKRPNPFYSGKLMWMATVADYMFGNAYWIKERSGAGKPVRLYWIPSTQITPCWPDDDPTVFISHYDYTPNGVPIRYAVEDVVHFRNGIDPKNTRKGLSKLGALLREIATDDEASEYQNTVLHNLGMNACVISPANEKVKLSEPDAAKIKASVISRSTGDRRGEPLVLGGAVKIDSMALDPSKLDLKAVRYMSENRITAIFGTPAIIIGLGSGLERSTFNNVDEARKIYYENKMIPTQQLIAEDIDHQLLVDFGGEESGLFTEFSNKNVRVLQEDEDTLTLRIDRELRNGTLTMNEARQLRDRKAMPEDAYMLDSRIVPTAIDELLAPPQPVVQKVPVDASGNPVADAGSGTVPADTGTGSSTGTNPTDATASPAKSAHSRVASTKDVADSVIRVRTRMQAQATKDVYSFLKAQQASVLAQIPSDSKSQAKIRINWPRLQEDVSALTSVLEPWYKRVLVAVHDVVQDSLDARYELSGTSERSYLKSAGVNIRGINETTRAAVKDALATSVSLDESNEELTARIETLGAFSEERAQLIAKTELAAASNLAQVESYIESDLVVGVLVTDGDSDPVCSSIHGSKVPIAEARSIPPLAHPHCVRKFYHIMDVSELDSVGSEAA